MLQLTSTHRAVAPTLPRNSRVAALPLARPSRTFVCKATPADDDPDAKDKDGFTKAQREAARERRAKLLADAKIPDASEAQTKKIVADREAKKPPQP